MSSRSKVEKPSDPRISSKHSNESRGSKLSSSVTAYSNSKEPLEDLSEEKLAELRKEYDEARKATKKKMKIKGFYDTFNQYMSQTGQDPQKGEPVFRGEEKKKKKKKRKTAASSSSSGASSAGSTDDEGAGGGGSHKRHSSRSGGKHKRKTRDSSGSPEVHKKKRKSSDHKSRDQEYKADDEPYVPGDYYQVNYDSYDYGGERENAAAVPADDYYNEKQSASDYYSFFHRQSKKEPFAADPRAYNGSSSRGGYEKDKATSQEHGSSRDYYRPRDQDESRHNYDASSRDFGGSSSGVDARDRGYDAREYDAREYDESATRSRDYPSSADYGKTGDRERDRDRGGERPVRYEYEHGESGHRESHAESRERPSDHRHSRSGRGDYESADPRAVRGYEDGGYDTTKHYHDPHYLNRYLGYQASKFKGGKEDFEQAVFDATGADRTKPKDRDRKHERSSKRSDEGRYAVEDEKRREFKKPLDPDYISSHESEASSRDQGGHDKSADRREKSRDRPGSRDRHELHDRGGREHKSSSDRHHHHSKDRERHKSKSPATTSATDELEHQSSKDGDDYQSSDILLSSSRDERHSKSKDDKDRSRSRPDDHHKSRDRDRDYEKERDKRHHSSRRDDEHGDRDRDEEKKRHRDHSERVDDRLSDIRTHVSHRDVVTRSSSAWKDRRRDFDSRPHHMPRVTLLNRRANEAFTTTRRDDRRGGRDRDQKDDRRSDRDRERPERPERPPRKPQTQEIKTYTLEKLNETINRTYDEYNPSGSFFYDRLRHTLKVLRCAFRGTFSPCSDVYPVGSCQSNLATNRSVLDVTVLVTENDYLDTDEQSTLLTLIYIHACSTTPPTRRGSFFITATRPHCGVNLPNFTITMEVQT